MRTRKLVDMRLKYDELSEDEKVKADNAFDKLSERKQRAILWKCKAREVESRISKGLLNKISNKIDKSLEKMGI